MSKKSAPRGNPSGAYALATMRAREAIDGLIACYRRDIAQAQWRIENGAAFDHDAKLLEYFNRRLAELNLAKQFCEA
jgi:hypothetical protein